MTSEIASLNNTNGQEQTLTISDSTITFADFTLLDKTDVDYYVITVLDGDVIMSLEGDNPPTKVVWKSGGSDTLSYSDMSGATWIRSSGDVRLKVVPCNDSGVNDTKHVKKQQLFQAENVKSTIIDTNTVNTDSVKFDLSSATAPAEGQMNWNNEDGVPQVGLGGGVVMQIGNEMPYKMKANGIDISNGQVVYISDSTGVFPIVDLANASSELTSNNIIGVATEDIASNSTGYVTIVGLVRGINTSHVSVGRIYLDTTDGAFTSTPPTYPNHKIRVGHCYRSHATEGVIFVNPEIRSNSVENIYNGELEEDLRFPANRLQVGLSNPPQTTIYKGGFVLSFEDEAVNEDIIYFTVQLPHSWKEGSSVKPHVHWVGENNTAGNVVWKLTYSWANKGAAFPTETAITVTSANSATLDAHNVSYFPAIDGTGKEYSSILLCSLSRNSSNVDDTFTGLDARLLEVDFHYILDKLGTTPFVP